VQYSCCRQRCFVWTVLHTPGWHTGTRDFRVLVQSCPCNLEVFQFHNPAMQQQCSPQVLAGCLLLAHAHTAARSACAQSPVIVAVLQTTCTCHKWNRCIHKCFCTSSRPTSVTASVLALWLLNCVHALLCCQQSEHPTPASRAATCNSVMTTHPTGPTSKLHHANMQ
jgi:hypothetical protein